MSKISAKVRQDMAENSGNATIPASYQLSTEFPVQEYTPDQVEVKTFNLKDGSGSFDKLSITPKGDVALPNLSMRSGMEYDDTKLVKVGKFVASRDHLCSNGTTLVKGTAKWFAFQ